jgi:Holliday junction DNA helicase RuvA
VIAHLHGTVAHRDTDRVVVDVAGVGYLVHVPAGTDVPPRGQRVELATAMVVREDAMTLYGFGDQRTRELFELLLSASGVGPKLALAVLSTHRPATVVTAIVGGDLDTLVAVPGVGKKSAQRLVLELREKLGAFGEDSVIDGVALIDGDVGAAAGPMGEVREALAALGYAPAEVAAALRQLAGADAEGDTATLLRLALRALGGRG